MDEEHPASDSPLKDKADSLHALISGPLAAAAAKASARSRNIPAGKDFHFFFNFNEFKAPVKKIKEKSESSLSIIAASDNLWGSNKPPKLPNDLDEACDWLVGLNDELLDRLAISMDEFKRLREAEEAGGKPTPMELEEAGFELVYGKKKKKIGGSLNTEKDETFSASGSSTVVNVAMKDKRTTAGRSKVPFHIRTIPRPQYEYKIIVNNKNQPFDHVWLETSSDGSRFIHPLEKFSIVDFVDRKCDGEPIQPLPLEGTPFKLVEGVNDLKMVAAKLQGVDEFAVDLEHNQYRSFQGLTCLMQISTRAEDFVIDTLKLRIHIGPHLREVFKDPSKRKIMHGADRDIIWLQRDFGIYVCNLFDTGQASRVLQMERNSLEYLLNHFCGVNANKEYQNADWRLRPIPAEMLKYAREDTHYLFFIYDQMKRRLLAESSDGNDLLLEVYKRSGEICMQLYEKELYTETSFLNIYGLAYIDLNAEQLAVAAGLCQWRDSIARAEDESTGYILPNKTLLEIARLMPTTSGKLCRLLKSKHPFVECHLLSVIEIIKRSIANSSSFEGIAEQLKEKRLEANMEVNINTRSVPASDVLMEPTSSEHVDQSRNIATEASVETVKTVEHDMDVVEECPKQSIQSPRSGSTSAIVMEQENNVLPLSGIQCLLTQPEITENFDKETRDNKVIEHLPQKQGGIASVQLLKKPTQAFGALFGASSFGKKLSSDKVGLTSQDKNVNKVKEIKFSVALPFHSFSGGVTPSEPDVREDKNPSDLQVEDIESPKLPAEVIPLATKSDDEQIGIDHPATDNEMDHEECSSDHPDIGCGGDNKPECNTNDPADVILNFDKCFLSINERRNSQRQRKPKSSKKPANIPSIAPYDYSAARGYLNFGRVGQDDKADTEDDCRTQDPKTEIEDKGKTSLDSRQMQRGAPQGMAQVEGRSRGSQPRRRQAFPPSGNRSMTYY
ncbi:protein RRP6-like 1 [Zingiber officinale]|uniref:protein RRP6-like 1 n=1 Tax=Zingiber officinale TaxID=94328 RepID=UPI001C4AD31C|nr:protein RRP6-like 1 [Zingiber officinale]